MLAVHSNDKSFIGYNTINGIQKINENGKRIIEDLELEIASLTQQQVYDILSLQNCIYLYPNTDTSPIRWKSPNKTKQGGHFNIKRFKNKILSSLK